MSSETLDLFVNDSTDRLIRSVKRRQYKKSDDRRVEIMMGYVTLLSKPAVQRYSTKDIAAEVGITESNIYRHFKSKSDILVGILEFCDQSIEEMFSRVDALPDVSMVHRAVLKLQKLLAFGQLNPGISRILTGEALVYEDDAVIKLKEKVLSSAQRSISNTYKLAIINNELPRDFNHYSQTMLMMSILIGRWVLFSQSHFTLKPTDDLSYFSRLLENL